jgi:hypothetical protein
LVKNKPCYLQDDRAFLLMINMARWAHLMRRVMMTKSVAIDEMLIKEAQQLGHHKNGKEAVVAALKEYIQRNKQMAIVELFGQIDYQTDYDYKANRL